MKTSALIVLTVFALFAGMQYALAHHGPDKIVIDDIQKTMPPVTLQHHSHQDRVKGDCTVCHHKGDATKTEQQPCSDCHGKVQGAPDFKDAMHINCQGCHKEKVAEGLKPPTMCPACHVKQ